MVCSHPRSALDGTLTVGRGLAETLAGPLDPIAAGSHDEGVKTCRELVTVWLADEHRRAIIEVERVVRPPLASRIRRQVYQRDHGICQLCRTPAPAGVPARSPLAAQADHIAPWIDG